MHGGGFGPNGRENEREGFGGGRVEKEGLDIGIDANGRVPSYPSVRIPHGPCEVVHGPCELWSCEPLRGRVSFQSPVCARSV